MLLSADLPCAPPQVNRMDYVEISIDHRFHRHLIGKSGANSEWAGAAACRQSGPGLLSLLGGPGRHSEGMPRAAFSTSQQACSVWPPVLVGLADYCPDFLPWSTTSGRVLLSPQSLSIHP